MMGYQVQDIKLKHSAALPASGSATVELPSIDLGGGEHYARCELVIEAPALDSADLPDGETVTYRVQHSADGSAWSTLYGDVLVQTGASSSGADADSDRVRLPSNVERYVRGQAETSAGAGDCSDKDVTESLCF